MSPGDHVDLLVDDYLNELLPLDQARQVEEHCAACARCRAALERARRRLGLLRELPASEPSARLVKATLGRVLRHDSDSTRLRRRLLLGTFAALAAGLLLVVGAHGYFAAVTASPVNMAVLGQSRLFADSSATLRVRVTDRAGQAALPGVPVRVELRGPDGRTESLASFTTDEHGSGAPSLRLPDWAPGRAMLLISADTPQGPETLERPVELVRSRQVMVSSDKPVYQPGQTIRLRALSLRRPDLHPDASVEGVFTVSDPKGNVVFKHRQPTSAHGLTWADCPLAHELIEGPYQVSCAVGDVESKLTVEVKKYVLPKFNVVPTANRPYYQPGEHARLTLQADYFFGKPVAAAAVEVSLITETPRPRVLRKVTGTTDARGQVTLDVPLPPALVGTPQDEGDARVTFAVAVTDSAGQKVERALDRLVTTRPVRVECQPEGGLLVPGVANTVFALVTRADGSAVPGVEVTIASAGLPGKPAEQGVALTDGQGAASVVLPPEFPAGAVNVTVREAGGTVLARRQLTLAPSSQLLDFLLRPDRAAYAGGTSMRLTVLGNGTEPVFVDVLKDGQALLATTIEMKGGRGETTLDLPPDLFGTLELVAYRFAAGVPVRKTRVVYVAPADGLTVKASLDGTEYRPGQVARLTLALTDRQGAPAPGAISLAAVDEAVFAVLAQKPGTEQAFYTLHKELLEPAYALYPAWMPDPARGAEPRDLALAARTSRVEAGGMPRAFGQPVVAMPGSRSHTLSANTYPAKEQEAQARKARGLDRVKLGYGVLLTLALTAAYASLWLLLDPVKVLIGHGALFIALVPVGFLGMLALGVAPTSTFRYVGAKVGLSPMAADMAATRERAGGPLPREGPLGGESGGEEAPPRVRQHFPETLLWLPQVVTDEAGRATVEIPLADSITTWRVGAAAVGRAGQLGSVTLPLKVFQPFFVELDLPVALTRNDKVAVPAVVYNYLPRAQTVTLSVKPAPWFTLDGPAEQKVELQPGEVRAVRFPVTCTRVGSHDFEVTARGDGKVADALRKTVEVAPDGERVEVTANGTLDREFATTLELPADAIEGSARLLVKIYPSTFSQVVEGLDNIFRMPSGCFEQTSSTTYPNVMALAYLKQTGKSVPAVEVKARQYIHLGYQRLLTFEVPGGGFDWYGRAPANVRLTAYGLLEFEDMARVHDVDPALIQRTRAWLMGKREGDGSWAPDERALFGERGQRGGGKDLLRLQATAYVATAVFRGNQAAPQAGPTLGYLNGFSPAEVDDPYTLALVARALVVLGGREGGAAKPWLDRLDAVKQASADGKGLWWEAKSRTLFFGSGPAGHVEATASATLANLDGGGNRESVRRALAWLISAKDSSGTWHSTQATVLALEALLAATKGLPGDDADRLLEVRLGDYTEKIVIPPDQAEVMRLVNLTGHLKPGANRLTLTEATKSGPSFQVAFRHHTTARKPEPKDAPLAVRVEYDRMDLNVGETVKARLRIENLRATPAPMVMLDLPVPPGFAADPAEFAALARKGVIGRHQMQARGVLVYLRSLEPGRPLEIEYSLRATMPVKAAAPPARAYEYYDPQQQGRSAPASFTVKE